MFFSLSFFWSTYKTMERNFFKYMYIISCIYIYNIMLASILKAILLPLLFRYCCTTQDFIVLALFGYIVQTSLFVRNIYNWEGNYLFSLKILIVDICQINILYVIKPRKFMSIFQGNRGQFFILSKNLVNLCCVKTSNGRKRICYSL